MSIVEKFYREFSDPFSVEIENWELLDEGVTVLWGPSGAGKSTILNGLLGLDSEAKVIWKFKGEDISLFPPGQRHLGVVFQDPALFTHMTAQENILFPVNKKLHTHWQQDFTYLTETLGIQNLLSAPVTQLSGGEKQRVAIARAFIYRPRMLLLDEPFSQLDEGVRHRVRTMVKQINQQWKCPILLVTHDRQDVMDLGTKVTQIDRGRIIKEGGVNSI